MVTSDETEALREHALRTGTRFIGGANRTITLDDDRFVWFVESGSLDIFAIESAHNGLTDSGLKPVFRANDGDLALPFITADLALRLVAKGTAGSVLRRVPFHSLLNANLTSDLAVRVDAWVTALCEAVTRDITLLPDISTRVQASGELAVGESTVMTTRRGVQWVVEDGDDRGVKYLSTEGMGGDKHSYAPITTSAWVDVGEGGTLHISSTKELIFEGRLLRALGDFHNLIASAELLNRHLLEVDSANAQQATRQYRLAGEQTARQGFFRTLTRGTQRLRKQSMSNQDVDWHSALAKALSAIGKWERISFHMAHEFLHLGMGLDEILRATGIRYRRVTLTENENWWRNDGGSLLGFLQESDEPVALLPRGRGGYLMTSVSGSQRVNADSAKSLHRYAWSFLAPLPDDRAATKSDVVSVAKNRLGPDLLRLALLGLVVGMVLLMPAVVTGIIANSIIPARADGALFQLIVLLVALAVIGTLLRIRQGSTLLKIEARVALRLDAAVQDRIFKLAPEFIRKFTSGNLATRACTFRDLRDRMSGSVVQSFLSALFLLPMFGMLFFYDTTIGFLSLLLGMTGVTIGAMLGLKQFDPQRRWYAARRDMSSVLRQFFRGIGKIKTSGAESSAFTIWAHRYKEQQQAFLDIGGYDHHLVALGVSAPAFAGAMLLGVGWTLYEGRTGDFLTIYAASMVFYLAVMRLGDSFAALAGVWPGVDQVRPLLAEVPDPHLVATASSESSDATTTTALEFGMPGSSAMKQYLVGREQAIEVRGEIHLQHVSWGYEEGPLVLDDVSLQIFPGQFVAIVGESGAGKSTLLRLALGLARPFSGSISYDGRDIERMDAVAIRSTIGVVLQDGDLSEGSIEEAITGVSSSLTTDDAWRAARIAAVSDDIKAMPMGMHTVIGPNAASLSGGQVQRIQIAAALVRNPRVLFLDEATNWLDNRNQAEVMANIDRMQITRVVVAHRLSTIRNADQIYVLKAGKIVQHGTYDTLVEVEGTFQELVKRQLD